MSIRPVIAHLGLFLCILGLPAAFSDDENTISIPHIDDVEGILDTAVDEPLETIKDNGEDVSLLHNAGTVPLVAHVAYPIPELEDITTETEIADPSPPAKCINLGRRCYRSEHCCSGTCHHFLHRCIHY